MNSDKRARMEEKLREAADQARRTVFLYLARKAEASRVAAPKGGSQPKKKWGILAMTEALLRERPSATADEVWNLVPDDADEAFPIVAEGIDYDVYRDVRHGPHGSDQKHVVQVQRTLGPHENRTQAITQETWERYYYWKAHSQLKK